MKEKKLTHTSKPTFLKGRCSPGFLNPPGHPVHIAPVSIKTVLWFGNKKPFHSLSVVTVAPPQAKAQIMGILMGEVQAALKAFFAMHLMCGFSFTSFFLLFKVTPLF